MSHIYKDKIADNLKPVSEMTEADLELFKNRFDFFMWVYNRTWVQVDEEAINRAIAAICASIGYESWKVKPHKYAYQGDPLNAQ